jgi:DNA-binding NtrC family response regulator
LRERIEDIPLLVTFSLQKFSKKLGRPVKQVTDDTMRRLAAYSWPGNIRELQNVIERASCSHRQHTDARSGLRACAYVTWVPRIEADD